MMRDVHDAAMVAWIRIEVWAGRVHSLIHAAQGKSALLGRLAVIALALSLLAGEAMAKNRPWAI